MQGHPPPRRGGVDATSEARRRLASQTRRNVAPNRPLIEASPYRARASRHPSSREEGNVPKSRPAYLIVIVVAAHWRCGGSLLFGQFGDQRFRGEQKTRN